MTQSSPPKCRIRKGAGIALRSGIIVAAVAACGGDDNAAQSPETADAAPTVTSASPPQDDLQSLKYDGPHFDPDYNNLVAQPWVVPVEKEQQDAVDVYPDHLVFPDSMNDVGQWQAGRIIVGGPGAGTGMNAMGFMRKVVSVMHVGTTYVVATVSPGVEEVLQGDVQATLNQGKDMDLTKVDPQWVADNLYQNTPDIPDSELPGNALVDDFPAGQTGLGFFSSLTKIVSGAAKAVASAAKGVYVAVSAGTVMGSTSLAQTVSISDTSWLFDNLKYQENFRSAGGHALQMVLSGSAQYTAGLSFNPGLQFGATIALPGRNASSNYWMNIDSNYQSHLNLDLALDASLTVIDGTDAALAGHGLSVPVAADILGALRQEVMGNPDVAPANSWKKTLLITKPSIETFLAGIVPVVVTSTFQVDLVCGFQAKAGIKVHIESAKNETFKFKVSYNSGTHKGTIDGPTYTKLKTWVENVTGEGQLSLSCGLVPRVNVFLYDAIGLFAGVRGSFVASTEYQSTCKPDPHATAPDGKVTLSLDANVGVEFGARIQAPGASFLGKEGDDLGFDLGPFEPWNSQWNIDSKTFDFSSGFGFCTPTCLDAKKDYTETDVDCGGSCGACAIGKACSVNSGCVTPGFCSGRVCSTDSCHDGVSDLDESDVDCGGKTCGPCAAGKRCGSANDCVSGYCATFASKTPNTCVANHCSDGVQDADEGGVDCGGATCAKCAVGAKCQGASDCASGFTNGVACVATSCDDLLKSGDETGVDCGGSTCAARCGFTQSCATSDDCSNAAPICDPTRRICLLAVNSRCSAPSDCGSATCTNKTCASASCMDGQKNGTETDVDCGGASCQACADTKVCNLPSDCVSKNCTSQACVPAGCQDGIKNGNETSVDCGGGTCAACDDGVACKANGDCVSMVCARATLTCATPSCSDTVKNGNETDVDCGGQCGPCADHDRCNVAADCISGTCGGGVCGATGTCADGVQSNGETDVDCGGPCAGCGVGKKCNGYADCTSHECSAGLCIDPSSCTDGAQNGTETDVDCGGACRPCANGKGCGGDSDCTSDWCRNSVCGAVEPIATSPQNGAVEVDIAQAVSMTFGIDLDASTVTQLTVTATSLNMSLAGAVSYANDTITFTPSSPLPQGATVNVTLGTSIHDAGGHAVFETAYAFSFTTLSYSSLISQWKFDDNGTDSTGNGHTVTLNGTGATYTSVTHQGIGALILNGTNGYGDAGTLDVGNEFTIAGWFFLPTLGTNINTIIATTLAGTEQPGFKVFINSYQTGDGRVSFESGDGSQGCLLQTPSGFVTAGQWQHFAIVVNRPMGEAVIFWNGVAAPADSTQNACVSTDFTTNNDMRIGRFPDTTNPFPMNGSIDDLRIYNRMLSAAEIAVIAAE